MKDMLSWDQTLFKDSELFELHHIPEHFLHREKQMQSLMYALKPALRDSSPLNCLCIGQPGTGKTTALVKIFEEIEKHTSKVIPVLVNCQVDSTRYAIFSQIFKKVIGFAPPSSGRSFKKVFSEVMKYLEEHDRILIAGLDDMNYLFYENVVNDVLYSLLRAHEIYHNVKIGVIAVLSYTGIPHTLDPKVESVFMPEEISFPPYTMQEIWDILSNRVKLGFYPGVIDEHVLRRVVEYTHAHGDLRVGIDLLKRAGLNAERRASRRISIEDVESAYEKSRLVHLSYVIRSLKKDERALLALIAESPQVTSGELYERFHSKTKLGYTRFYEMLNKLKDVSLIHIDFTSKGQRGRSRIITPCYSADEIKTRL